MIVWMEWGEAAFARARSEKKPIFLHIGATWCHWCHVMEQESYTHPEVERLLGESFVPVRVDTDRRPDVNERYNHGGWPTAAILDAEGEVLVGRLYVPALELLSLLRSTTDAAQRWVVAPARPEPIPATTGSVEEVWAAVRKAHDPYHGGFGEFEKFPHVGVCEWLLDRRLRGQGDEGMLDAALRGMSGGELYDREEGGFFRYCTQDDWRAPHYEKLLEDNARLLSLYLRAGHGRREAEGVLRWMLATLWSEEAQAFGGSQDADADYYARPRSERAAPPSVDPTIFAGHNGLAIEALVRAAAAWGRPGLRATALAVGHSLLESHVDPDGAVRRCRNGVVGLLEDQAGAATGLLALWQATGDPIWRDAVARVLGWTDRELRCEEGGYFDGRAGGLGLTRTRRRPLHGNAALATVALRFALLSGDATWREIAERAATGAMCEAERYNFMAAPAAAAWELLQRPPVVVKVNANPALLERVLADPMILGLASAEGVAGTAQACTSSACARPARTADELDAAIRSLR